MSGGRIHLFKYDPAGNLLWKYAHSTGAASERAVTWGVRLGGDGVYVLGEVTSAAGGYDPVVLRVNSADGQLRWASFFARKDGGQLKIAAYAMDVDPAGNAYVTGIQKYPTNDEVDAFTLKVGAADGAVQWMDIYAEPAGDSRWNAQNNIVVDAAGNAYSYFTSMRAWDDDVVVLKYNTDGERVWLHLFDNPYHSGDSANDLDGIGRNILLDAQGNVIFTGDSEIPGHSLDFVTVKLDQSLADPTATPSPTPTPTPTPEPTPEPTPVPTPIPTPEATPEPPPYFYIAIDAPAYSESAAAAEVRVCRTGDLSAALSVGYQTTDGTARDGYDYMAARGTLHFAAGESEKIVRVPLIADAYAETDETFTLVLIDPSGGAQLGAPSLATFIITNAAAPGHPADSAEFFVRQHYLDFLGREPDSGGLAHWANEITSCGADAVCREARRENVSAAFFLSIEFQETGYLVYRLHKAAYGDMPGAPVPLRREELLPDMKSIGEGVIVGTPGWAETLDRNKSAFARSFVARPRFASAFPAGMSAEAFVAALDANAGGVLAEDERDALVAQLAADQTGAGRASVLVKVAEHAQLKDAERNKAFVLMQYFGYMRRDPNEGPDTDWRGWQFWLKKLDDNHGNFVHAQMVRAFLDSFEYRNRFAP